jgi:REP element-mobilizing transposase RayT
MDRYWFLTTTFYGNWLPGDSRGFVSIVRDRRPEDVPSTIREKHNEVGTPYDSALSGLHDHAQTLLKCDPIRITLDHANTLCSQFHETAQFRQWELRAIAIMEDHVHVVVGVGGDPSPTKVLGDFKAYGSRALNRQWGKPASGTWWTYDGSKRKVDDEVHLRNVIRYVRDQPNPLLIWIDEVDRKLLAEFDARLKDA